MTDATDTFLHCEFSTLPQAEVVVWMVLRVLRTHYETESLKIGNALQSLQQPHMEKLTDIWKSLLEDGMSFDEALTSFTQYIKLNLEEDGCIFPHFESQEPL